MQPSPEIKREGESNVQLSAQQEPVGVPTEPVPVKSETDSSQKEPIILRPETEPAEKPLSEMLSVGDIMVSKSGTAREFKGTITEEGSRFKGMFMFTREKDGKVIEEMFTSEKIDATKSKIDHIEKKEQQSPVEAEAEKKIEEERQKQESQRLEEEQKRERAFEFLANPEITKERQEDIVRNFMEATGEDLLPKVELRLKQTLLIESSDAILEREQVGLAGEERSRAMATCLDRLPESERNKFNINGAMDMTKFAEHLGRVGLGLGIKEPTLNTLINNGYMPEKSVKRNWGIWLRGPAIEIPTSDGKGNLSFDKKKDFKNWAEEQTLKPQQEAQRRADSEIIKQQERLSQETGKCIGDIIKDVVDRHNLEKQEKQGKQVAELRTENDRLKEELEKAKTIKEAQPEKKVRKPITKKAKAKK